MSRSRDKQLLRRPLMVVTYDLWFVKSVLGERKSKKYSYCTEQLACSLLSCSFGSLSRFFCTDWSRNNQLAKFLVPSLFKNIIWTQWLYVYGENNQSLDDSLSFHPKIGLRIVSHCIWKTLKLIHWIPLNNWRVSFH